MRNMVKILHTGDLHLDSAFVGLSPEEARYRRAGLRKLVSDIIDIANNEAVDAIIMSGDQFDAYPIYPESAESFIHDLARAKMPVFLSPGNHDPYTANSPYRTLHFPENVHIFTSENLSAVELAECRLRVFGACFTDSVCDSNMLKGFHVPDDDFVNVIALHANLNMSGYCPITENDIAETGADYIALSHIHKPTDLLKAGDTYYAYCGCPEARAFDEQYDTGIIIMSIGDGKVDFRRCRVSDFRYRELTLDISKNPDIASLLPPVSGRELLRLTLVGECNAPDISALEKELSTRYYKLYISDRTQAPRDIWEGIDGDSLRGIFLRSMRVKLDSCTDDTERERILLAVKFGIDAIENRDISI